LVLVDGDPVTIAVNLAYPVADVLLLALLIAVGAILGLRREPVLWLFGGGMVANLVGDVVYLDLAAAGVYVEGGPLDLTWLLGVVLLALAVLPRQVGETAGRWSTSECGVAAVMVVPV
jgi:peptidoglycan/LPS O-acetylase OafA/YrhL